MRRVSGRTGIILLIEDDAGDRELFRLVVEGSAIDAQLKVAEDGEAALDYLNRRGKFAGPEDAPAPDLIILDLNMPKLSGREVLSELRSSPKFRSIPIVILTTSSRSEDVDRCYELGCNSFVTKPSEINEFNSAVERMSDYWFDLVSLPRRKD